MTAGFLIPAPSRGQRGFVLAATLWMLAIIMVAAGFFALWTQQAVDRAYGMRQRIDAELDMVSTRSTMLYLLGTQRMTTAGLTIPAAGLSTPGSEARAGAHPLDSPSVAPVGGELALDDRTYRGIGRARFSLQDERGLFNLRFASDARLSGLLGLLGVDSEMRTVLIDRLRDYTDSDNLHRLNGAEAGYYRKLGLPPPPNRPLRVPLELRRVAGWGDQPQLWKDVRLLRLTSLARDGLVNINTAPSLVLQTLPGVDAVAAERLVEARQQEVFSDLRRVALATGLTLQGGAEYVIFYPSRFVRLTLWYEGARRARQIHIELTPWADKKNPWSVESSIRIPLNGLYSDATPQPVDTFVFQPASPAAQG